MARASSARAAPTPILENLLIVLLLTLAVMIVLSQANPWTTRLGRDSGMYAYVASHVLRGDTPYVSAWEHKPPGIFFVDAAGLGLAGGTRWGIWGMELVFLLGAAVAGYHALKQHFGAGPALLASLTWLAGLSLVLEGGNFTEEFSLTSSFISLLLFGVSLRRPSWLWLQAGLGLAFGCSFLLRPNNAGVLFAIFLTQLLLVLLRQRTWRETLRGWEAAGVGFLLPAAAVTIYFLRRDAFQVFLEAAFLYNLSYGGNAALLEALISGVKHLGFAAGVGLVGMGIAFGNLASQFSRRAVEAVLLWLGLDFVLEILLSGLSGLNYPHYFISWLPWVAFAAALLFSKVFPALEHWYQKVSVPALVVGVLALSLASLSTLADYAGAFSNPVNGRLAAQRDQLLPQYVNEHTQPGETVLVWGGEAGINFLAGRDAPTAHFQYGILVPSPITERISAEFYNDVLSHPPSLILDEAGDELPPLSTPNPVAWSAARGVYAPPYLQEFFDLVQQDYTYKTTVAGVPVYYLNR